MKGHEMKPEGGAQYRARIRRPQEVRESEQFNAQLARRHGRAFHFDAQMDFNLRRPLETLLFALYLHHALGGRAQNVRVFANRRERRAQEAREAHDADGTRDAGEPGSALPVPLQLQAMADLPASPPAASGGVLLPWQRPVSVLEPAAAALSPALSTGASHASSSTPSPGPSWAGASPAGPAALPGQDAIAQYMALNPVRSGAARTSVPPSAPPSVAHRYRRGFALMFDTSSRKKPRVVDPPTVSPELQVLAQKQRLLNGGLTFAQYIVKHGGGWGFVRDWPKLGTADDAMGEPLLALLLDQELQSINREQGLSLNLTQRVTLERAGVARSVPLGEALRERNATVTYPGHYPAGVTGRLETLRLADSDTRWVRLFEYHNATQQALVQAADHPILHLMERIDQWVRDGIARWQPEVGEGSGDTLEDTGSGDTAEETGSGDAVGELGGDTGGNTATPVLQPDTPIQVSYRRRIAPNVEHLHRRQEPAVTKSFTLRQLATGWHQALLVEHEILSYGDVPGAQAFVETMVGQTGALETQLQASLAAYEADAGAREAGTQRLSGHLRSQAFNLLAQPGVSPDIAQSMTGFMNGTLAARHGLTFHGQRLYGVYYIPVGAGGVLLSAWQPGYFILRTGTRSFESEDFPPPIAQPQTMDDAILPQANQTALRQWLVSHLALTALPEGRDQAVDYEVTARPERQFSGRMTLRVSFPLSWGEPVDIEQLPQQLYEDRMKRLALDIDTLIYTGNESMMARLGHLLSHLSTVYGVAGALYGSGASLAVNLGFWALDTGLQIGAPLLQRAGSPTLHGQQEHDRTLRSAIGSSVAGLLMMTVPRGASQALARVYTGENIGQAIALYNLFDRKVTSFSKAFVRMKWPTLGRGAQARVLGTELQPFMRQTLGRAIRGETPGALVDRYFAGNTYAGLDAATGAIMPKLQAQGAAFSEASELVQHRVATPLAANAYVPRAGEPVSVAAQALARSIDPSGASALWVDSYTAEEAGRFRQLLGTHLTTDLTQPAGLDAFCQDFWSLLEQPVVAAPLAPELQRVVIHQSLARLSALTPVHRGEVLYALVMGAYGDRNLATATLSLARLQARPDVFGVLSEAGQAQLTRVGTRTLCKRAADGQCVPSSSHQADLAQRQALEQRVLTLHRSQEGNAVLWHDEWDQRMVDRDVEQIMQQAQAERQAIVDMVREMELPAEEQEAMFRAYGVDAASIAQIREPVCGVSAQNMFKLMVEAETAVNPVRLPAMSGDDFAAKLTTLDASAHHALLVDDARLGHKYLVALDPSPGGLMATVIQSNLGGTLPELNFSDWMQRRSKDAFSVATLAQMISSSMKALPVADQDALFAHVLELGQDAGRIVRESGGRTILNMDRPVVVQGMTFEAGQYAVNVGIIERKLVVYGLTRELEKNGQLMAYLQTPLLQCQDAAQEVAAQLASRYPVQIVTLETWKNALDPDPGQHVATQIGLDGKPYIVDATLGQYSALAHYRRRVFIGPRSDWVALMLEVKPLGLATLHSVPAGDYRAPVATADLYPGYAAGSEVVRGTVWFASSQSPYGFAQIEQKIWRDEFATRNALEKWPGHGHALAAITGDALRQVVEPAVHERNFMGLRNGKTVKADLGPLGSSGDTQSLGTDAYFNELATHSPEEQRAALDTLISGIDSLIGAASTTTQNGRRRLTGLLKRSIELRVRRQQLARLTESGRLGRGDLSVLAGKGLLRSTQMGATPTLKFSILRHDAVDTQQSQAVAFEPAMLQAGGRYQGLLTSFNGQQVGSQRAGVSLGYYWGPHLLDARVQLLTVGNGHSGTVALKIGLAQIRRDEPVILTSGALSGCTMIYARKGADLYVFHAGQSPGDVSWHTGREGVQSLHGSVARMTGSGTSTNDRAAGTRNDDLGALFASFDQSVITYLGKPGTRITSGKLPANVQAFDYNRIAKPTVGRLGYSYALVYRDARGVVQVRGLSEDVVIEPGPQKVRILDSLTWTLGGDG
ncbi:cycle-inhibiting factor [Paraburkholderia aspalathi]|uniref:cycle-inhibiting factor n=1 Tax=Paraburkholderia aspalathi TaxID=1324617 RepID=UPI0038BD4EF0